MYAIQIQGLTKEFEVKNKKPGLIGSIQSLLQPVYSKKIAVQSIDFNVHQGETLAFLGPNGAGKSTTIKMLTGILHPTAGKADVLGYCPWTDRKRLAYHIGSVFGQKSQLWYHLPPIDTFELMSRIYELNRADYVKRRNDLVERFELGPYLHSPVRKLSLGERMRCEIAASMLHRPRVVFLDEPTIGLDVIMKQRIRELIREMNQEEGMTVFLTSHDPGDIEYLCRRAVVINHGRLILDQEVSRMKKEFLTYKTIRLKLLETNERFDIPGAEVLQSSGNNLKITVDTSKTPIDTVLASIIQAYKIDDVTIEDPPMEEIITHIYERLGNVHEGGD
jgi:ABC-2 type transport system ATP-binding protein